MRIQRLSILVFMVCFVFVSSLHCWSALPNWNKLDVAVRPLIEYVGLWRNYAVFAKPPRKNSILAAVVTFDDASQVAWSSVVVDATSDGDRSRQMRLRKFFHDNLLQFRLPQLRRQVALYIARLHSKGERKPVSVELIEQWAFIPSPQQGLGRPLPPLTHSRVFYKYRLTTEDLAWIQR